MNVQRIFDRVAAGELTPREGASQFARRPLAVHVRRGLAVYLIGVAIISVEIAAKGYVPWVAAACSAPGSIALAALLFPWGRRRQ